MDSILITGFEPFGGQQVNPAWMAVERLPDVLAGAAVHRLEIPTVFGEAFAVLKEALEQIRPRLVLSVGQAGGRAGITMEQVAINLREASIPDNAGRCPSGEPVVPGGPAAYFATVPVKAMAEAVRRQGIPASVSYSAGTFVLQ